MTKLHKHTHWILLLIAVFLVGQWSSLHYHPAQHHDHDNSHHQHSSHSHSHALASHHSGAIDSAHQLEQHHAVELCKDSSPNSKHKQPESVASASQRSLAEAASPHPLYLLPPELSQNRLTWLSYSQRQARAPPLNHV